MIARSHVWDSQFRISSLRDLRTTVQGLGLGVFIMARIEAMAILEFTLIV